MYDALTNSWSAALLDQEIGDPAIIAVGNRVYLAGGSVSSARGYQTNKVWTFQFLKI
jgi:hypothetical protein